MNANPVPDGFHTVTPYLLLADVAAFLSFVAKAFDAEEVEVVRMPGGEIMHAQVRIGDSPIMIGQAVPEWPPMQAFLYLYVPDPDALYHRALEHGATSLQEPKDEFYGDRVMTVRDAFGNVWCIAKHQEDVPEDELLRRATQARG